MLNLVTIEAPVDPTYTDQILAETAKMLERHNLTGNFSDYNHVSTLGTQFNFKMQKFMQRNLRSNERTKE